MENVLRPHTHQPGWFDLFSVIISGMMDNAGEQESYAFLQQMGGRLAQRYPLAEALTVQDLEVQINLALARFNWGFIDVQPHENALVLTHMALPSGDRSLGDARWQRVLGAVLTGLYSAWLRAQGGSEMVPLVCEATDDSGTLVFRYQNGL